MEMALKIYEDTLKSFIHDDDKLVTYKWLSKELEVHVNIAKDILKQYWEKHKEDEKIVATFLLIGELKDGSIQVEVVKESNLNSTHSKFLKVNCEHLYSLQKSLQDIELLAFAGEGDLRYSAIKCNTEYVRSDEEIDELRYVGNIKKEEKKICESNKSVNKLQDKQVQKQGDSLSDKCKTEIKKIEDEKEKIDEKSVDSKKDTQTDKKIFPTNTKQSNNLKTNGKLSKKPVQSKQSGFNNLFGKSTNKSQTQTKLNKETNSNKDEIISAQSEIKNKKIEQEKENKNNKEIEIKYQQSNEEDKSISKSKNKIETNSKLKNEKRGTKRDRSQETNSSSSKRKRIVVIDSSEDESERSTNEEEEEEAMEIVEQPKISKKRSPSPPAEKRENGKRMIRKTIDKTFKDEDGYLVTKRVHIYEVASDNEEPEEIKKEPQKSKPVEVKAKKKQTTLTNFFKKP